MTPDKRKEMLEELPVFDSHLNTAPRVDASIKAALQRMDKEVNDDDVRHANRQQLTLEVLMAQTRALDAVSRGDNQGCTDILVDSMRLTALLNS